MIREYLIEIGEEKKFGSIFVGWIYQQKAFILWNIKAGWKVKI